VSHGRQAAIAAALLLATAPSLALADTLVDNVSGDHRPRWPRPTFSALVFDDAGVIKAIYRPGEKKPPKGIQYHVDGKGRIMLPGLIDAHAHVMQLGFAALTLDLSDTKSLAEALGRIKSYAAEHPDRPWIIGRGWRSGKLGTGALSHSGGTRCRRSRQAGLARTRRWPCRLGQWCGAESAGVWRRPRTRPVAISNTAAGAPAGVLVDAAQALVARSRCPRAADRDVALATANACCSGAA
jgi:predicted amidohydrolase YtcJ